MNPTPVPHHVSPLRICVASSGLGHVLRGIEAWAQELGNALAARGLDVFLCKGAGTANADFERIIPCWKRNSAPTRRLLNLIPRPLGWRLGLGAGYGVEQTTFAWNLLWFLRRQRIDILHIQDPQVALLVQRAARAGVVRTRTLLNHGTEEPFEFLAKIDFLQHGAPWHQQMAEQAGVQKTTWTMIPNFVDIHKFSPGTSADLRTGFGIPEQAIVALVSSAIKTKHKRIDYLINEFSCARAKCPELPLWLVLAGGRSEETECLLTLARQRLGQRVCFAIDYQPQAMPDLYRMADFLLHGSLMEMMPMALLEASASGLPCLCHRHPVMQWMVGPGGLPLNLQHRGTLAAAIVQVAQQHQLRRELGTAARAHCVANYASEVVLENIIHHYAWVHSFGRGADQCAA